MADITTVEAPDSSKNTSEILGPDGDDETVQMSDMDAKCYWNDVEFQTGDKISSDGKCYECSFGRWIPAE
ncbi:MAG: hypothetical protein RIB78_00445 [Gammaproteobacteria bacterium]